LTRPRAVMSCHPRRPPSPPLLPYPTLFRPLRPGLAAGLPCGVGGTAERGPQRGLLAAHLLLDVAAEPAPELRRRLGHHVVGHLAAGVGARLPGAGSGAAERRPHGRLLPGHLPADVAAEPPPE